MRRVLLTSLLGLPAVSMAIDVDPMDPSGSLVQGSGTPAIESPAMVGEGFSGGVIATVNENLLTLNWPDGREENIVPHTFNTVLMGAYTKEDRYRIELAAPVYWHNAVDSDEPFRGAALGDLLIRGNFRLYQNDTGSVGFSVVPALGLPTGSKKALVARGTHLDVKAAVGGELNDRFGYAANLGFVLQPGVSYYGVAVGSSVDAGAGVWVRPDEHFRLGADYEVNMGTSTSDGVRNVIASANVFGQMHTDEGIAITVGAGRGMLKGIGSPDWRVITGVTYAPFKRDADDDGIVDKEDTCPLDAEDFDNFEDTDGCPEIDNDGDTLIDVDDLCPNQAEDFDNWMDLDGCAELDNDEDGWVDAEDSCPNRPGLDRFQGCPDTDNDGLVDDSDQCVLDAGPLDLMGCPDGDADLVPDYRDACPDVPRLEEEPAAQSNGCPKKAFVQGDRIQITERVLFETGRSTIRGESYDLLDDVVEAMQQYPQITSVQVAGHTDNKGGERYNVRLSNNRAKAVHGYLTKKGLDAGRLEFKGFGESDPIDSNFTESGRQRNRRVEFRILEQTPFTEEVATQLGDGVGALTIKMPSQHADFADLFVDGRKQSPRAPVQSFIVTPGPHDVLIKDARYNLDYPVAVTVMGGQTHVIEVPAESISDKTTAPVFAPAPVVPAIPDDTAPLAVPVDEPIPAEDTALPEVVVPDVVEPVVPDVVEPVVPDVVQPEVVEPSIPAPAEDAELLPQNDRTLEVTPEPVAAPDSPWGTDPDAFPVTPPADLDESTPSDDSSPWNTTTPEPEVVPPADAAVVPPVDVPDLPEVDEKAAAKEAKKAAKALAKQEKADAKAREKAAKKNKDTPPDPIVDPSTVPTDDPWTQD